MFETEIPTMEIALRLGLAVVLGMTIGWEREAQDKPAGLRTHMMVALGSATFFIVAIEFVMGPLNDTEGLNLDPTRIIEGVIGGIGFLGAGAIIQGRGNVRGLTTGTSIWVVGAIGLACGGGYYVIAAIVTLLSLFTLLVVGYAESIIARRKG